MGDAGGRRGELILEIHRSPVRVVTVVPVEAQGKPALRVAVAQDAAPMRLPDVREVAELYVAPNKPVNAAMLSERWGRILRRYGLPDFPPDRYETAPVVDPGRLPPTEHLIPLRALGYYASMASRLCAFRAAERGDYRPLKRLLPGHRGDLEPARRQMVAGDLLTALGTFHPTVDLGTGLWAFSVGGWWPLVVFNALVRSPRARDVLRCACGCGRPVPPARARAGRYARGRTGEHYATDQCMWREKKRRQRARGKATRRAREER